MRNIYLILTILAVFISGCSQDEIIYDTIDHGKGIKFMASFEMTQKMMRKMVYAWRVSRVASMLPV